MKYTLLKFISRKLLTMILASVLLWYDKINSYDWLFIAGSYMLVVGYTDAKTYLDKFKQK